MSVLNTWIIKHMKKIFFALGMSLFAYAGYAQNTARLLDNYFAAKNALVSGDSQSAAQAAAHLQQSIKEDGSFAQKETLLKAIGVFANAGNLDKQRAAFNEVSTTLWAVVKSSDKQEGTIYYQYCPMKKAYWLSQEKGIKNPYYGAAMLSCGKTLESN